MIKNNVDHRLKIYLDLFSTYLPEILKRYNIVSNDISNKNLIIALFLVGVLQLLGGNYVLYNPDIKNAFNIFIKILESKYSVGFIKGTSYWSLYRNLKKLNQLGYVEVKVEKIVHNNMEVYRNKYKLTPKGQTVFDSILRYIYYKEPTILAKAYISKKDEIISQIDESYVVSDQYAYFKDEKLYRELVSWATVSIFKLKNPTARSGSYFEQVITNFYVDHDVFGLKFRDSLFLRWDNHILRTEFNLDRDIEDIFYDLTNVKKGLRDVIYFLFPEHEVMIDPVKIWARLSSLATSIFNDAQKIKREPIVKNLMPVILIMPKDSPFYDKHRELLEKNLNEYHRAFPIEGVLLSIFGIEEEEMGTIYICPEGHIYWDVSNEAPPEKCTVCGQYFENSQEYKIQLVKTEFALKDKQDILTVYIPIDLYIFMSNISNYIVGLQQLLVINATNYIGSGKKNTTHKKGVYLAVGYYPQTTKIKISESEKSFIYNNLASKPTWEILYLLSSSLYKGIFGFEHAKVAALLTAFSQTYKRISKFENYGDIIQVDSDMFDYSNPPAPIYTLFIGKPGTGKSTIAKKTLLMANTALGILAYVNLKRASVAGITATSAVAPGSRRKIYLGIERAAHGTMIVYDEIDKASDDSLLQSISDTMSEGFFTYDKAYATMLREVAISAKIFVANDRKEEGYFDFEELLHNLVSLDVPKELKVFKGFVANIIDRFDFIVYFPKLYDSVKLIKAYQDISVKYNEKDLQQYSKIIKAYINLVREFSNNNHFTMRREVLEALMEYLDHIKEINEQLYKYLSSPRRLDSIIKIARTIAAMHFRNEITIDDVREAIAFLIFVITYPFADKYIKALEHFSYDLGIYYKYYKAVAENIDIYSLDEKYEEEKKVIIRSKSEFIKFIRSLLKKLDKEYITFNELRDMLLNMIENGELELKPIKSWRPTSIVFDEILKEIVDRLNKEGVLLYDSSKFGSGAYKINKNG